MASPRQRNRVLAVLDAPWARPVRLLLILIVLWDVAIRIFQVPAYLVPTPGT